MVIGYIHIIVNCLIDFWNYTIYVTFRKIIRNIMIFFINL